MYPLWLIPVLPLIGFAVNGLLSLGSAGSKRGPSRESVYQPFWQLTRAALVFAIKKVAACACREWVRSTFCCGSGCSNADSACARSSGGGRVLISP